MDYRLNLAMRMLANKRGSLIGAVLAVSIGILVIHVNFVIFQGIYDAIIRDMSDYRFGDVFITHQEEGTIERSSSVYTAWLERFSAVKAATPRLGGTADIEFLNMGQINEEYDVSVLGVEPVSDLQASKIHETVDEGQYVYARNSIVVGETVARDLGGCYVGVKSALRGGGEDPTTTSDQIDTDCQVKVGNNIKLIMENRVGEEVSKRFVVSGISKTAGGQGFDNSVIVHIDTLRSMLDRPDESNSILVRMNDRNPLVVNDLITQFSAAYQNDDLLIENIEQSAESTLKGFRSGIAMINLIGYFGMMSSAFAIVVIQMMLVSSKTREIGVMRAIGAKRKDILIIFIFQGMVIGLFGAAVGTGLGLVYTTYAKITNMQFEGSLALEVNYNWEKIGQTAFLAFGLAVIASLYPSYRATKLQPVEAMRTV
ncbi:MAG: FtsX-like permease family protein [Candidatus Nitrosopelagicus sp.]|nr:FtsX-like permease family protein [Candidatus Nitrosopelagicus sp.]